MKKYLLSWVLICGAFALAAAEAVKTIDFTSPSELKNNWAQLKSAYYSPLGTVESTPAGVKLTAKPQKPVFIAQNDNFVACEGDKVEVSMTVQSPVTGGVMYVSLLQFGAKNRWLTNATDYFYLQKGEQTVTRVITIKKARQQVLSACLGFGPSNGRTATVSKVTYRFVHKNYMPGVKANLPKGLVLHLDGSKSRTLEQQNGKIAVWRDISGQGNDVKLLTGAPQLLSKGINNLSSVRFAGKESFKSLKKLPCAQGVTVFIVFRRTFESTKGDSWQDSLYWGKGIADHTGTYHMTMGRNKGEEAPRIFFNQKKVPAANFLIVGANGGNEGYLWGDVGEVLIFNRTDLRGDEIDQIRNYLLKKWNIKEGDYVRLGPLPPTPKRISNALPLSDQANKGKWRLIKEYSDEFNGTKLDRTKWTDTVHYSIGGPVRNLPDNLIIKDGMAQIVNIYDPKMPSGRLTPRGEEFHSFSNSGLYSLFMPRYGYFEARTKLQGSTFNNAFWLIGAGVEHATGRRLVPEIDIYEIAPKSFASEQSYNMALHIVQHQPKWMHLHYGRSWKADFKFDEGFHVYGLEWTPKVIRYYVDGALVREFQVKKNWWDVPMTVQFNSLPHFDWFGVPDPEDFPCTYYIDYFRFFKNPETDLPNDWDKKYKIVHKRLTEGWAFDYYKKYGNKIVMKPNAGPAPQISHDLIAMTKAATANWKPDFEANAQFMPDVANGKPGMRLTFPPMLSRKNSGEVQYAAPFGRWPKVELTAPTLKITDWKTYKYLALDFHNPRHGIEAMTIVVETVKGKIQHPIIFKSGVGVYYWKLPPAVQNNKIKKLTFNVRGTDRPIVMDVLNLRLEK